MAKEKPSSEKPSEEEVRERTEANRLNPPTPSDLHEYEGKYRYTLTGEIFGLKVLPDMEVRAHKTHHAKSESKFWDGTKEEFRALFDKV